MSKKKIGVCKHCGKEFSYYPSVFKNRGGIQQYCSRQCYSQSRRVGTVCPNCKRTFWYHKSWPRKYCSASCSAQAHMNYTDMRRPIEYRRFCIQCGKEIVGHGKSRKSKFCSLACFGKWQSINKVGTTHPCYNRITVQCQQCGKEFEDTQAHAAYRICCSVECRDRYWIESGKYAGENNPNWQGGQYEPYYGPSWPEARRQARARDNYTCQYPGCGLTEEALGCELDVHHLIAFRAFDSDRHEEANALSNLKCFCKAHHTLIEPRNGGATFSIDQPFTSSTGTRLATS